LTEPIAQWRKHFHHHSAVGRSRGLPSSNGWRITLSAARLVNPAGQPVNQAEEEEEMVEPPALPEIPAYKK
jgi:hypothetical protein